MAAARADAGGGLWALAEEPPRARRPRPRSYRWVVDVVPTLALVVALAAVVLLPSGLTYAARAALFAFGLAVILWTTTSLNAAFVALAATVLLVLAGGAPQERLFDSLASDVVWLMIGAFVLGEAVRQTGLASRMARLATGRARSVRGVLWVVTTILLPLAAVIPSTSGRAAVAIPLFRSLSDAAADARITRALALLMPTVILVSTVGTLVGAGSHLVANDLLQDVAGRRISFAAWLLYGAPFAVAAAYVSAWAVMWLFLDRERLARRLEPPTTDAEPFSVAERLTLAVTLGMVALWLTEALHGIEIATVAVLGAVLLTMPRGGVIAWKDGLKAVSWNLVLFVGAALVLGEALIETGAARWIIERFFGLAGLTGSSSELLVLLGLALLTLTSHIYMTSHTARAAALVPPLLYLGQVLELDPVAVMFLGTVGMDYCLTFPVSSKALLMFQELDRETYQPADLLRLSAVLMVAHVLLMVVFYYGYWRWIGLAL